MTSTAMGSTPRIGIIGGGASGALFAINLIRKAHQPIRRDSRRAPG